MEEIQIILLVLVFFRLLQSSKPEYTILPEEQRVGVNETAVFRCQNPSAKTIGWLLNSERVTATNFDGVATNQESTDSGLVNTLTIQAHLMYNESTIQCQAHFETEEDETTAPVNLLIQGPLAPVGNVIRSDKRVSWTPPFSLDFTDGDPDIVYCLQVFNVTQEQSLLVDECDIQTPYYVMDIPVCDSCLYLFIIVPVIHGSGINGTSFALTETYISLFIKAIHVDGNYSVWIQLNKGVGDVTPAGYLVSLTSIDSVDETDRSIGAEIVHEGSTSLTLLLVGLHRHRRWSAEILVPGSSSSPLASIMEISTHDVQNITASSSQPGVVIVTGDIVKGSYITDLVFYAYSVTTERFYYHHYHRNVQDHSMLNFSIPVRHEGMHYVWIFTLVNKTLSERPATSAIPVNVTSSEGIEAGKLTFNYTVSSDSSGTSLTCTFTKESNATACLAMVHTAFSFFNNSNNFDFVVVASFKFSRKGSTAKGFIADYPSEHYGVGAIEIVEPDSKGADNSIIAPIVSVLVVALLALIVVVAFITTIYMARRKKKMISQQFLWCCTETRAFLESDETECNRPVYVSGSILVEAPLSKEEETRRYYCVENNEENEENEEEDLFDVAKTDTETYGRRSSFICGRHQASSSHELPHSRFQRDMNSKATVLEQTTDCDNPPGPSDHLPNQHTQVVEGDKPLTDNVLPAKKQSCVP